MAKIIKNTDFCVELGVFGGRSLLPICLMTTGTVIGIDAWSKDASIDGENSNLNDKWWKK